MNYSNPIVFNAFARGRMSPEVIWIDFSSKKEKWEFLKKHLPDLAHSIKELYAVMEFLPPILQVDEQWLKSLADTQIHYPG